MKTLSDGLELSGGVEPQEAGAAKTVGPVDDSSIKAVWNRYRAKCLPYYFLSYLILITVKC